MVLVGKLRLRSMAVLFALQSTLVQAMMDEVMQMMGAMRAESRRDYFDDLQDEHQAAHRQGQPPDSVQAQQHDERQIAKAKRGGDKLEKKEGSSSRAGKGLRFRMRKSRTVVTSDGIKKKHEQRIQVISGGAAAERPEVQVTTGKTGLQFQMNKSHSVETSDGTKKKHEQRMKVISGGAAAERPEVPVTTGETGLQFQMRKSRTVETSDGIKKKHEQGIKVISGDAAGAKLSDAEPKVEASTSKDVTAEDVTAEEMPPQPAELVAVPIGLVVALTVCAGFSGCHMVLLLLCSAFKLVNNRREKPQIELRFLHDSPQIV